MAKSPVKSVDEYIASKPEDAQLVLKRVRSAIRKALPGAEETISYQIPTYKLNGVLVLYFAGWKQHFSLYPANEALLAAFEDELAPYEVSKGTIRFPLSAPPPVKLIEGIAKFQARRLIKRDKTTGRSKRGRQAQLERVRRICSTMPSSSEKLSHGAPTFFAKKDKGVFVMFVDNHHDDGRLAVWLPAPPGLQSVLIEEAPDKYFKPPYVGPNGWIGIELDQIRDEALEIHAREAWQLASGRKKTPRRL